MYYLRTKAATDAIKFTVTKEEEVHLEVENETQTVLVDQNLGQQAIQCSLDDPEGCEMCGS